jgi:hypothetical protein
VIPLFLILFASGYYVLHQVTPGSLSSQLTRIDSLYLTLTVFSTVGFGDIVPTSESARVFVSFKMVLNIVILGLAIRVLTHAVEIGKQRKNPGPGAPGPGASD